MSHNVSTLSHIVNTMDQNVTLGIVGAITQADLAPIRQAALLGDYALIYRIERVHQGGGYGDQDKHPLAWAVAVYVDGQLCRLFNARGAGREWNSLNKLSQWLCDQGFWYWWTRNDLEPLGTATTDLDTDQDEDTSQDQLEPVSSPEGNPPDFNF